VTINGIVYFLSFELVDMDQEDSPMHIPSFDLEMEEWRPILRGPSNVRCTLGLQSSLASLNGCIVMTHHTK
jgi:hypothetical protein